MHSPRQRARRTRRTAALSTLTATLIALSACGSDDSDDSGEPAASEPSQTPAASVANPIVVTYDGGLYVIDGETYEIAEDIPLDGFNRLNAAGDDRHVMVSTSAGFRVLDAAGAALTDVQFEGAEPGHVVRHAGRTVLFSDGTGEVTSFDPDHLGDGMPETETYTAAAPHHGVAIELANGELVVTLGTEEERTGIIVLDENREEIARNEDCPGVHGEATAQDEAVVIGCEDGVLIYRDGAITKVDSPTEYGRVGNQAGTDASPIVLGDYKQDADAELERPEQISLIDTRTATLTRVDLGTSYTFRSLARGPEGEALVLGTDGQIHVIDPESAEVVDTIPVIEEEWREPLEWQQPRPAIFVRDHTAYVTDPAAKELHAVDLESGEVVNTVSLPEVPNELSGVVAQQH
ncbi:zinc metallochaperone AztD [Streptomyces litchfieldiae]|uniref:Zinc metallochaperone AztD n=1 Tax=Streptomyces litchfieldiae TaxID=3075543 RepID=A0ABU2MQU3_9ACTN|nr:zinc metallochaperone AztD [Streptomyces sp. DSM 44938]MDT0344001.1 zinc metallochaperone AztD [Streptomyces sp. DSM 44938]